MGLPAFAIIKDSPFAAFRGEPSPAWRARLRFKRGTFAAVSLSFFVKYDKFTV